MQWQELATGWSLRPSNRFRGRGLGAGEQLSAECGEAWRVLLPEQASSEIKPALSPPL